MKLLIQHLLPSLQLSNPTSAYTLMAARKLCPKARTFKDMTQSLNCLASLVTDNFPCSSKLYADLPAWF